MFLNTVMKILIFFPEMLRFVQFFWLKRRVFPLLRFFFSGRFFLLVELKFDGWYTLILSLCFAIGPTVKSAEKRSV